jgi:hypothetical protein
MLLKSTANSVVGIFQDYQPHSSHSVYYRNNNNNMNLNSRYTGIIVESQSFLENESVTSDAIDTAARRAENKLFTQDRE